MDWLFPAIACAIVCVVCIGITYLNLHSNW